MQANGPGLSGLGKWRTKAKKRDVPSTIGFWSDTVLEDRCPKADKRCVAKISAGERKKISVLT